LLQQILLVSPSLSRVVAVSLHQCVYRLFSLCYANGFDLFAAQQRCDCSVEWLWAAGAGALNVATVKKLRHRQTAILTQRSLDLQRETLGCIASVNGPESLTKLQLVSSPQNAAVNSFSGNDCCAVGVKRSDQ